MVGDFSNVSRAGLFKGLSPSETTSLFRCLDAVEKVYAKGEVILREGEPTESIGVVWKGMAVIEYTDVWGNGCILGSAPPGALFAEAYACCPGERLLVSVRAVEKTDVLFLNIRKLLSPCYNACSFHAEVVRNLLSECAKKSLQLSMRMMHTTSKSIRGRLLSYFSACIKKTGSCVLDVPFNRQQLADYLGVDRSAMCNELSKMQRDGLIRYKGNRFEVNADPGDF